MSNYEHIFDNRQPLSITGVIAIVFGIFMCAVFPPLGVLILLAGVARQRGHMRGKAAQRQRARAIAARRAEDARIKAWLRA